MNASLLAPPVSEQLHELTTLVRQLREEVGQLRTENAQLRQQVSELKCDVGYWKRMHADAVARNVKLQAELDLANAEIRQLKAEHFGKQTEKQSTADRSNELVDPRQPPPVKNKRGQQLTLPAPRRRDYSHLQAREQVIDLDENRKLCDGFGQPLAELGFKDDGEQIEIETVMYRKVVRRRRLRRTCACDDQPRTITAASPPKILPKSRLGISVWAHLLIEKFQLQRPTHRTLQQLRLLGLSLAPGTVADGLKRIERMLTPIYQAIRQHHLQAGYYQADETRWRVFVETAGKAGPLVAVAVRWARLGIVCVGSDSFSQGAAIAFWPAGFGTLTVWRINPLSWLTWYLKPKTSPAVRSSQATAGTTCTTPMRSSSEPAISNKHHLRSHNNVGFEARKSLVEV